ncbi:MAG: phosphoheptose isomerase [Betaproteobacteria bacterium]|nr:phosphoheptose isomerase [Betaproteobacteria bacterium]
MDLIAHISRQFEESAQAKLASIELLAPPLAMAVETLTQALLANGKILVCGNGGSAADAQHFTAELLGRFERERPELAAIALTSDSATLTALANDYSLEQIFAKQVRALGQPNDILVTLSISGNAANILAAIEAAHQREMRVIALTGQGGGRVAEALRADDIHLCVPHERSACVQEIHILAMHCLCDGIDALLLGDA